MTLQKDMNITLIKGNPGRTGFPGSPARPGYWLGEDPPPPDKKWDTKHGEDFIGDGYRPATFLEVLTIKRSWESIWNTRDRSQPYPCYAECKLMKLLLEFIHESEEVGVVVKRHWSGSLLVLDRIRSLATGVRWVGIFYETSAFHEEMKVKFPGVRRNPSYNPNYDWNDYPTSHGGCDKYEF